MILIPGSETYDETFKKEKKKRLYSSVSPPATFEVAPSIDGLDVGIE